MRFSQSVMVPENAEELSATVGRCNHKDLGSPRGGLWESKAKTATLLKLLSKCSLGLPSTEDVTAPESSGSHCLYCVFIEVN